MDDYLADISRIPLLPEPEVRRLLALAQAGDTGARNRVVEANLRLVVAVVKRACCHRSTDVYDDMFSEGNLGLLSAVYKFDLSRGTKFSTYAYHWVRCFVRRALCKPPYTGVLEVPEYVQQWLADDEFIHDLDLNRRQRKVVECGKRAYEYASTDDLALDSVLAREDLSELDAEELVQLRHALLRLTSRQQFVLRRLYEENATYKEVSRQLGVTRQYIGQLKFQTLHELRKMLCGG